jgi:periplasmic divalent cation tolerance protein
MSRAGNKIVVLMTCDKEEEARHIADRLLRERKAACVSIYPRGNSFYWWKGEIESAEEHLLIAKTKEGLLEDLISLVKETHSYEIPEIISVPVAGGSEDYLNWLDGVLGKFSAEGKDHI